MLRLRHLTAATSLLLSSITATLASDTIQFLYPADSGLTYHYLDRVDVSYESNYSAPYLYTWCVLDDDIQGAQSDRPDAYNATTEITLQFTSDVDDLECWFNLREADVDSSDELGTNSAHWTYVNTTREGGPATLGLPTATGTPVSTPTASTITTTTVTASAVPSSSGLSTGAKAGIGVGIAIGIVAIAAMAGAFLFRRRKRRNHGGTDPGGVGGRASPPPFTGMAELEDQKGPAELGVVIPSAAAMNGKYAPVAPESPQELPADYMSSETARHELSATVDREHREDREGTE
ncbi:hypothetical protein VSDG_05133 [Cytospora chrysosperma]|uniref:Mid2 domain-containing protein n=1 Tax=Cytospora chrysosperma TaxID=252740 RepID=A0A423VXT8_CYTCH|nr:hypothetical protein VSDG_05133 [Valsa sordida]